MADALRGSMDAAEYKHVVLGLIFLKYISDAFEERHARLVAEQDQGADPEDPDEYQAENIFWMPPEGRWRNLKAQARQPTIGQVVDEAMTAVERDNPALKGYARPMLDTIRLGRLIDMVGNIKVGDADARSKDVLGRVYEYFLSQFASAEGKKGGEGAIRRALIEAGLVDCMVALPGQLFYSTQIPACLWFLARDRVGGRFRDRRGEVLEFQAGRKPASPMRRDDIHEVLNYRAAMRRAERMLEKLPLCRRVILEAHRVLLSGVRGEGRAPGEYRRMANWIGPPGCGIEEAHFVPPGAEGLPDAMTAWERYMHQDAPDRLVQLAILHAEFEALHPFLDGNGRLGRMLVPLFLWRNGLIHAPMFYISAYFEAHRDAYYDGLLAVSRDDDWTG